MIKVRQLSKYFGSRRAIHDLSFSAKKGEILGFLGPNGAGKTTTMRILTGFMSPSSGTAEVGGFDICEQSIDVRRIIGYLPETVSLYSEMKAFDYLAYMAKLHGLRRPTIKVDNILEIVGMTDRAESLISSLSKGLRQRLGLAQALIHDPKVLILDEPTIGLDPVQIKEVRDLIKNISIDKTILLSTHILSEAQQVCDRVLIINKGEIIAEDTTEKLKSRLAGNSRVLVKYRGDIQHLIKRIEKIPGVIALNLRKDDSLEIEANSMEDVRPRIAKLLVTEHIDLYELSSSDPSLEDVFLSLTRDEIPSPEIDGTLN